MGIYGIDVSSYQAEHYPTTVQGHRVDFAFIKATEGTSYVNEDMAGQAAWARSHGHVTGFYHFLHPGNVKAQAAYFVAKSVSQAGDILACDWESTSSGHALGAEKDAFMKEVKRLRPDHRVLLYCNSSDWKTRDTTSYACDGLWIAEYGVSAGKPHIQAPFLIHQYTSTPVDTNYAPAWSTKAAMQSWARGLMKDAPVTPPKPPTKPVVDLSNVVSAAKRDPKLAQGKTTHAADVKPVEAALKAEKLLASNYASDGSFGSLTVDAYKAWQRKLGYKGSDADGIPGSASLKALGAKHGFTVK